jgi:superoxide dismutase
MAQANLANQIATAERLARIEALLEGVLRKIDHMPPSDQCLVNHAEVAVLLSQLKSEGTASGLVATGLSTRVAHLENFEDSITQKIAYVSGAFAIIIAGAGYLIGWIYREVMKG